MGLFRKQKGFTPDELKVVDLVLAGDSPLLAKFRKQMQPPFLLYVERRLDYDYTRKVKLSQTYIIQVIYDGNLDRKYAANLRGLSQLGGLVIRDSRVPFPIRVEAQVSSGILFAIEFHVDEPVKWPRYLRVDDWGYVTADAADPFTVKERPSLEHLPVEEPVACGPVPGWLQELLDTSTDGGAGVEPGRPASASDIKGLRREIGARLPKDYREFLEWSDGCTWWGTRISGTSEAYLLDVDEDFASAFENTRLDEKLLVISTDEWGSVTVLALSDMASKGKSCPVDYLVHDETTRTREAQSFSEWLGLERDSSLED